VPIVVSICDTYTLARKAPSNKRLQLSAAGRGRAPSSAVGRPVGCSFAAGLRAWHHALRAAAAEAQAVMACRRFIVVSGLPATGKTTLGRRLAEAFDLPLIDKDDILESLFDSQGIGDASHRRRLSRESDAILRNKAECSEGAVLVSFWHVAGMPEDSGTPTAWIGSLSSQVVNILCECPPHLAAERFSRRHRHPGHLDREKARNDAYPLHVPSSSWETIPAGELVRIDTSHTPELEDVVREVDAALARCLTRACSCHQPAGRS